MSTFDENTEHEDRPEFDDNGEPIIYIEEDVIPDEFASEYDGVIDLDVQDDSFYETVWGGDASSVATLAADDSTTGEEVTDPLEVEVEQDTSDTTENDGILEQANEDYNNAVDILIDILTQALAQGEITEEMNASILDAQGTKTKNEQIIKEICNVQEDNSILKQLADIKANMVAASVDDIIDILTEGGTKPWLYKDSDNNVLVDSQSIPELTVLVNKLNLIATGGDDDAAEIQLTPEFINMVVQSAGSGNSVKSVTTMYYLSTSKTELIGGTWVTTLPTLTEQQGKYLWYKIVTTYMDSEKEPTESDPICLSGNDGVTYYTWIRYADDANGNGISNDPTGKKYIGFAYNKPTPTESNTASDYTWSKIQGEKGDTGVKGETGADGTTYYTWIKYSDNPDGTDLYDIPRDSTKYIGIAVNKTTANESTNKSDYTWSKFKGEDGKDGTGINIIDKLTSTSQLPVTGNPGDCYTVNGVLYVWSADTSTWVDVGNIKGEQGEPGKSSYLHIKYSDDGMTFTANDGETPGIYIGVLTNNTKEDSVNFNDYTWSRIRGDQGLQGLQGPKGEQGIQGPRGEQGNPGKTTYFHIKYSSNANGNPMTETPSEYIGTYVDYNATDSTDYTKYTWSRFQGLQGERGEQGIPGTKGDDGQTYYLHIKYSNDGGSTFTSNNGETPGTYIGVYTDTTQADSTSVSKYTWSKIKGEQGPQGIPGDDGRGVEEVIIQYAKNQSTTNAPTSGWSTTMPTYQEGYYLWMRTRIKYTDSTNYVYSTPVCDQSWKANQEVYTQYKQLNDKFTWIVSGGTSQSSMTLSDKMYELISKNITLTAEHINLNGYVSNDKANWSIDIDGNMETKNMNVEGDLSADTISCNNLNSPKYPGTLDGDIELFVNSSSGNDDAELEDNAVYKTIQGAIDALPKFLNGKNAHITMQTNSTEDVYLKGFVGGTVRVYMNGKTLYGTFRTYVCSAAIHVYGGTKDNTEGATGIIHPNVGLSFATRSTSVGFESSQYGALYKVKVFAPDTNPNGITSTEKVCVASQAGTGSVYCKNVQIVNAAVGFRCNNHGSMHVSSSSGIASKYGFQSVTGGMMSLANNSQAGGKTGNTNKSSGGQIWYDTSNVTFATGNQTTESGSAPSTSTTKTMTIKSTYGDTYRSSVYKNWKKDGTVRQGDYGYGDCTGCWFFGSAFSELKGCTISKVQITITRQTGGSSVPVEHKLWMHGHTSRPSGAPTLTSGWSQTFRLATGNSTTVAITDSAVLNAISAGTCKGFALRHTYDSVHYSVCSGNVTVKITYTE